MLAVRPGGRTRAKRAAAAAVLSLAALFCAQIAGQARRPSVRRMDTPRNRAILALLQSVLGRRYWPSWLTPNGHANSGVGYVKLGPRPAVKKVRELVRTQDGGNFAMDWVEGRSAGLRPSSPTLLVIHGLNGHSEEPYVLYALSEARARGWRSVALLLRGCGGLELTSGRGYSAAFTDDVGVAISIIKRRLPDSPLFVVGYSLGANLLVKFLGEEGRLGHKIDIEAAASISNPWDFTKNKVKGGVAHLNVLDRVVGMMYSVLMAAGLRMYLHRHKEALRRSSSHLHADLEGASRATSINEFDELVTAPLWGYEDASQYHRDASSAQYVPHVRVPLLCVNAEDDPIASPDLYPLAAVEANPYTIFVSTAAGGHIGWCEGLNPFTGPSWVDRVIPAYFEAVLKTRAAEEQRQGKEHASAKL